MKNIGQCGVRNDLGAKKNEKITIKWKEKGTRKFQCVRCIQRSVLSVENNKFKR